MPYDIAFSTVTGRSSVHAVGCSATQKRQLIVTEICAESAKDAALNYAVEHELVERGFPLPAICRCAR